MTDDDNEDLFPRASVLRKVLAFTFRLWARAPLLAVACAAAMLLATLTEVFVPLYAGRMIDAVGGGDAGPAWRAFAAIAVLGGAMVVLRHLGWWAITPLTLNMMRDVTQEAFARVQRLSTDWHANAFSGSTVRRITRGMWALDTLNDVLLLSLLPSLTVLVGTVILLAAHWPLLGLVMGVGALAYIVLTIGLATRVLAPIARLSNQWDTKIGGVLADAIGTNAVVKAFGGEAGEEALLARTVAKWHRRTRRTWMAFTWAGSGQLALLWLIRIAATGAALWLWSRGDASAGDMAYVLTSYLVLNGYLRDIGQYVHQLQRSVNEMEELVALHDEPLGVADRADARPIAIDAGTIQFADVTFRYAGQDRPLYDHLSVTIPAGLALRLPGGGSVGRIVEAARQRRLRSIDRRRCSRARCGKREQDRGCSHSAIAIGIPNSDHPLKLNEQCSQGNLPTPPKPTTGRLLPGCSARRSRHIGEAAVTLASPRGRARGAPHLVCGSLIENERMPSRPGSVHR